MALVDVVAGYTASTPAARLVPAGDDEVIGGHSVTTRPAQPAFDEPAYSAAAGVGVSAGAALSAVRVRSERSAMRADLPRRSRR